MFDKKAINVIFSILLAIGLLTSLLYSINLDLNSDTVVPGLVAMEIVEHHSFDFSFPFDDPYLFTDIFTFHFIPQVLSGYDPAVLRLTAYAMFLMVVGMFSYLVYKFSGFTGALIFAALATNLPQAAYGFFLSPEYHVGTLLFTGVFLLLFQTEVIKKVSFNVILALSFLVALIVLSDSIFIAFFILPYLAYCLYRFYLKKEETDKTGSKKGQAQSALNRKKEVSRITAVLITLALSTVAVYILKANNFFLGLNTFFITPGIEGSVSGVTTNAPLFVNSLLSLLNGNMSNLLNRGINWFDLVIAAIFVAILVYSFVVTNKKAGYLYAMFLLAAVTMLAAFVFTGFADGLWSARFLIYVAISIFAVIALAYKPEKIGLNLNTAFLAAIVVIILASVSANLYSVSGYDYQPNQKDYALISYLENNGLTYGYTDYNNGNKLIYLSKEKVLYPKVETTEDQFLVYIMLTAGRWYDLSNGHGNLCLLVNKNDTYYQGELSYVANYPANNTYQYDGYTIYQYTNVS